MSTHYTFSHILHLPFHQAINQRHERIDTAAMIQGLNAKTKASAATSSSSSSSSVLLASGITAEDEELVKSIRFRQQVMN